MFDLYEVSLSDGSTAKVCTPADLSWPEAVARIEKAVQHGYRTLVHPPLIIAISRDGSVYMTQ